MVLWRHSWLHRTALPLETPCKLEDLFLIGYIMSILISLPYAGKNVESSGCSYCSWACKFVQQFWGEVLHHIKLITGNCIPQKTELIVINVWQTLEIPKIRQELIISLTVTKWLIATKWKNVNLPSIDEWYLKIWEMFLMDKVADYIFQFDMHLGLSKLMDKCSCF